MALLAAIGIAACGAARASTSAGALSLRRQDLAAVCVALQAQLGSIQREVAAARAAWPLVANGVAQPPVPRTAGAVATAAARAGALTLQGPFSEEAAASLTGPAATIAGLFRSYALLSDRGWSLIAAAAAVLARGPSAAAAFARQNVALYIESVYDAHFTLAQVGRKLLIAYAELGGPAAFGSMLAPALIDTLADALSEATDRLHPHVGVRLGS